MLFFKMSHSNFFWLVPKINLDPFSVKYDVGHPVSMFIYSSMVRFDSSNAFFSFLISYTYYWTMSKKLSLIINVVYKSQEFEDMIYMEDMINTFSFKIVVLHLMYNIKVCIKCYELNFCKLNLNYLSIYLSLNLTVYM